MSSPAEAILRQQLDALQAFDRLLVAEHACLLQAGVDQLPALTEQKTAQLAALEAIEQQRQAAFRQDTAAGTRALWAQVQTLAKQVSHANQRNGAMITALTRNTEGALHILRGASEEVGLYGAQGQGQQAGGPAARLLASA
ncbi:MAG: flagellar export chaperone FlgN [Thiomonas sp.]|nr:flagellar export chaperone FlgN [Thiomonas sp.]